MNKQKIELILLGVLIGYVFCFSCSGIADILYKEKIEGHILLNVRLYQANTYIAEYYSVAKRISHENDINRVSSLYIQLQDLTVKTNLIKEMIKDSKYETEFIKQITNQLDKMTRLMGIGLESGITEKFVTNYRQSIQTYTKDLEKDLKAHYYEPALPIQSIYFGITIILLDILIIIQMRK